MADPEWAEVLTYRDMVIIKSAEPQEGEIRLAMDPEEDDVAHLAEETGRDVEELQLLLARMEAGGLVQGTVNAPRSADTWIV